MKPFDLDIRPVKDDELIPTQIYWLAMLSGEVQPLVFTQPAYEELLRYYVDIGRVFLTKEAAEQFIKAQED